MKKIARQKIRVEIDVEARVYHPQCSDDIPFLGNDRTGGDMPLLVGYAMPGAKMGNVVSFGTICYGALIRYVTLTVE